MLEEPYDLSLKSGSSMASPHCLGNSSQTEIKLQKVNHSWTVKNFSHCYQEYLENFVYLSIGTETLTWSIKIYPKGNGENNKDFVFLCLNRIVSANAKTSKVGFKSRFILRTAEMKEIDMRIHPNPSHSDYVSYIKRDVLFPQILPKDLIIVDVEIDVAVDTITTTTEPAKKSNYEQRLVEDYQRLFRDDLLKDFTIRVGGKEIRAHRAILAARSPVFQAMLMNELTSETKRGVLEISDLDYDVVYEMVHYIYCGRCRKEISDIAADLLMAADKYGIVELKDRCEEVLLENLTEENACQLLILGDLYSAEQLQERAVEFILRCPKYITSMPGWNDMLKQHPHLVTRIVNNFHKVASTGSAASTDALAISSPSLS
ncbi:Protein maternal effect lethal 26 [Trichostrongylus colubriformis]|uniref:Protein maternal effect lethal 26 n=1 Tax=Trichostrongylus colubriformis TaxID=6319 RepID=A0AAN8GAW1_TRICO